MMNRCAACGVYWTEINVYDAVKYLCARSSITGMVERRVRFFRHMSSVVLAGKTFVGRIGERMLDVYSGCRTDVKWNVWWTFSNDVKKTSKCVDTSMSFGCW